MPRLFLLLGAVNGFLTVALGAFAAHALKPRLEPALYTVFQTGVDYQGLHSGALLAVGLLALHCRSRWLDWSGILFTLGTLLFSGSLYLLATLGARELGLITPFGGIALLLGWSLLIVALLRLRPRPC